MPVECKYLGCNNTAVCVIQTSRVIRAGDGGISVTMVFSSVDRYKLSMPQVTFPVKDDALNYASGDLYYIPLCEEHKKQLYSEAIEQVRQQMRHSDAYRRMSDAERTKWLNLISIDILRWDFKNLSVLPTEQEQPAGAQKVERALRKLLLKAIVDVLQRKLDEFGAR